MTELGSKTDQELIESFKQTGDQKFLAPLIERYKPKVHRKCLTYVQDHDTAEDLTQDILLKMYLKISTFKSQAKFSTWLFSIIHNVCIDHLRKSKRNTKGVLTKKLIDEIPELVEDEDDIPKEITTQILDELLDQLSPEDKLLLLLKYREKHTIKDIQNTFGVSESAIKMRLKRAKEKINQIYAKLT